MGIRYYAYPVDSELAALAEASPRDFLSADPLVDAWGPVEDRPPMLYLDKCWYEFQVLFGATEDRAARPAHKLVAGSVVMHGYGWTSFVRYLDPAVVAEIAADLSTVTKAEIIASVADGAHFGGRSDATDEVEYVMAYLGDAVAFTTQLASEGRGLVYLIG